MVRLFVVGMMLLLVAEVVAAVFFLAGYFWIGGWWWGVILAVAAVLIFVILPWVGEFVLDFDSRPQEWKVKLSWWGRVQVRGKEAPELRLRLFGILSYRKKLTPKSEAAPSEPKPDLKRFARHNVPALLRALLAALQVADEVVWGARALTLTINAPTETDVVDQIVAGIIGTRPLGPIQLRVLPEGPRRVRLLYRIPMRTIVAAGLYLLVMGRIGKLLRGVKKATRIIPAAQKEWDRGC